MKNNKMCLKIKKIISVFIAILLLLFSSGIDPVFARGYSGMDIATQSIFSPLTNTEIKDIAMLEYVLMSGIRSGKLDPMREAGDRTGLSLGIDLGGEGVETSFQFSRASEFERNGVRLVPCVFRNAARTVEYWFSMTGSADDAPRYKVTFITGREKGGEGFAEKIGRLKYAERAERSAVSRAAESEKGHDEKIRDAISNGKYLAVTKENYDLPIFGIYAFLNAVSQGLLRDFMELVDSGQLMIITEEREGRRLEKPHAGGRGIYLPNGRLYLSPEIVVHELFAKAGFKEEECRIFRGLFKRVLEYSTDGVIVPLRALPEGMPLSGVERALLEEARTAGFIDLTERILTRDYSAGKEPAGEELTDHLATEKGMARKKAKKEVEESERKFRGIFDESPIGIIILDPDGRITNANKASLKMASFLRSEDIEGLNFLDYVDSVINKGLRDALSAGEPVRFEAAVNLNGIKTARTQTAQTYIDCLITPLDGGGKTTGYLVQIQDITSQKAASNALINAYAVLNGKTVELEQAVVNLKESQMRLMRAARYSALLENTRSVLHEVTNPLANALIAAENIENTLSRLQGKGFVEAEEISKNLKDAKAALFRIQSATSKLQDLAESMVNVKKVPSSVEDILQTIMGITRTEMEKNGIKVNLELRTGWTDILADKGNLVEAFLNIVMNAGYSMRHTERKELTIRTEEAVDEEGKDIVRVSFIDTGCGIPENDLERIWEPFYRGWKPGDIWTDIEGDDTPGYFRRSENEGIWTGLGLAIVKDVARQHSGKAKAVSQPGRGSTFIMEFPLIDSKKKVIKLFTSAAQENIRGSLLHDINNALAMFGYFALIQVRYGEALPGRLAEKCQSIQDDIDAAVALIRQIQELRQTGPPEEITCAQVSEEMESAARVLEAIKNVDPDAGKDAMVEQARNMLREIDPNDLLREHPDLMGLVKEILDAVNETNNLEKFLRAIELKLDMTELRFQDITREMCRFGEERGEKDLKLYLEKISEGFKKTQASLTEGHCLLGIGEAFPQGSQKLDVVKTVSSVLRAFKNSTRFFKNAQIYPDDVEVSTPDTGIFMKAEKASFKFVLYN
ncbi:MAG: PAS domain-containing sensor histidine kinase, partial [Candidatus Omnitrophota bacterium]